MDIFLVIRAMRAGASHGGLKWEMSAKSTEIDSYIFYGRPCGTLPELLFEKKGLIPALQQLLVSHPLLT